MERTQEDDERLTVPLLEPKPAINGARDSNEEEEEEVECGGSLGRRVLVESKSVVGPSICARFSTVGVTVISQAFIGHIGATELAPTHSSPPSSCASATASSYACYFWPRALTVINEKIQEYR
uniref:Uncharacterized protein n=1 Tax=Oryza meridionalis TaxID=40149 RepID=A0A0E0EII0_9ORYZ